MVRFETDARRSARLQGQAVRSRPLAGPSGACFAGQGAPPQASFSGALSTR